MNWIKNGMLWFFLCCCLFVLCPRTVCAGDTDPSVKMDLTYGFGNEIKKADCVPLRVKLSNPAGEARTGTIRISQISSYGESRFSKMIWMTDESYEHHRNRQVTYEKTVSMEAGADTEEIFYLELPAFGACLYVEYVENGEEQIFQELNLSFEENSNNRFLIGILSDDLTGADNLDGTQITPKETEYSDSVDIFVKIIPLKAEDIYTCPEALDQLDLLIADPQSNLTDEQQLAVRKWGQEGGLYTERSEKDLKDLFVQYTTGEHRGNFLRRLSNTGVYYASGYSYLDQVPVSKRPGMVKYLLILCSYLFLVGPVLYLVLKKQRKRRYLWNGICLLSLGFTALIWLLGRSTKVTAPFILYDGMYTQEDGIWSENIDFDIRAPYNKKYNLYLDPSYLLQPGNMGLEAVREKGAEVSAENLQLQFGEEKNKVTMSRMTTFSQNPFSLRRMQGLGKEEEIQLQLSGDGQQIWGQWSNPTHYTISNAVLVMRGRIAWLGDMKAETYHQEIRQKLCSSGSEGAGRYLEKNGNFARFAYPSYVRNELVDKIWTSVAEADADAAYVIGVVENPDLDFQLDSGYAMHGNICIRIAADVNWESEGLFWCPNLEYYTVNYKGDYSADTNLLYGKSATVDYDLTCLGNPDHVELQEVEYEDTKYFFPFRGTVSFYNWRTGTFVEMEDWETTYSAEDLAEYLSEKKILRIRYQLDPALQIGDRSCTMPGLRGAGKRGE